MKKTTEIELTQELLRLHEADQPFAPDDVGRAPVEHYFDPGRFALEQEKIFRRTPQPLVHSSELPESGDFLRRDFAGLPTFLTRDADGAVRAFLNVCRHRGTQLVADACGRKKRFSCPYHAWTWNNRGELIGVPHEATGFPELNKADYALTQLPCIEKHGWIWVSGEPLPDIDVFLGSIADDFAWFGSEDSVIAHTDERLWSVNWKILVEGGIEAYHFRVAHKDTIAPYFLDNLSTYQAFGPHLRSLLARKSLAELAHQPSDEWRLRDHAQVLYSLFPVTSILVQSDHFVWIVMEPVSAAASRVRINTVVPKDRLGTEEDRAHWARNHEITMSTLVEDFEIGESIQSGLQSGANTHLTFGRFESALSQFSKQVEAALQR